MVAPSLGAQERCRTVDRYARESRPLLADQPRFVANGVRRNRTRSYLLASGRSLFASLESVLPKQGRIARDRATGASEPCLRSKLSTVFIEYRYVEDHVQIGRNISMDKGRDNDSFQLNLYTSRSRFHLARARRAYFNRPARKNTSHLGTGGALASN